MKHLKVLLPFIGFLVVFIFIISSIEVSALKKSLLAADPKWLGFAFGITILQPFLTSLRLKTYLSAGNRIKPYSRCLKAVLAALSLNAVLPAKGGDLVKVTFLQDDTRELAPLAGLALMERVLDILILCIMALMGSLFIGNQTTTFLSAFAICTPIAVLLFLGQADKVPVIGKKLIRLAEACKEAWKKPRLVYLGSMIAVICWSTNLGVMYCLLRSVGASIGFIEVAAATPLAIFVGLLPVSISGMGTRDAALAFLLTGTATEVVYAGTFLYTATVYWFLALFGLIFLGRETLRMTTKRTQATQDTLKKGNS